MKLVKFIFSVTFLFLNIFLVSFCAIGAEDEYMDRVKTLLREEYQKIRTIEDKDVVLVLGDCTAGKSTIINRFLGCQMEKRRRGAIPQAYPLGRVHAKMGKGISATTLFPEAFQDSYSPFVYCDCPGFLDDRGEVMGILGTISTQLAVKKAKSIKAVMVVIDAGSFRLGAAKAFKNLAKTLGTVLEDRIGNSPILFVVNKGEDLKTDDVIETVEELIEQGEQELNGTTFEKIKELVFGSREPTPEEVKKANEVSGMLKVLGLMRKENVQIANIFELSGANGRDIEKVIAQMAVHPINRDIFHFDTNDDARLKFNNVMLNMIQEDLPILEKMLTLPSELKKVEEQVNQDISTLETIIKKSSLPDSELLRDARRENGIAERISEYEASVLEIDMNIQSLLSKLKELGKTKEGLKGDDSLVIHWSDGIYEKRNEWIKYVWWTRKDFKYFGPPFSTFAEASYLTTQGYQDFFEECRQSGEDVRGLKFSDHNVARDRGQYLSTYKSALSEDGNAQVRIFIPKNRSEYVTETVRSIEREMERLESEIFSLNGRRIDVNKTISNLKRMLVQEVYELRKSLQSERERLDKSITEGSGKHQTLSVNLQETQLRCTDLMSRNGSSEITYDVSRSLEFDTASAELINRFQAIYDSVKKNRKVSSGGRVSLQK